MTTTEKLAARIKVLREVNNYTQEYVANAIGVSTSTYGLLEKGEATFDIERTERIADLYKIQLLDLLKMINESILDNIKNNTLFNISEGAMTSNTLGSEEKIHFLKTIERLEKQNEKLMSLLDKLIDELCK